MNTFIIIIYTITHSLIAVVGYLLHGNQFFAVLPLQIAVAAYPFRKVLFTATTLRSIAVITLTVLAVGCKTAEDLLPEVKVVTVKIHEVKFMNDEVIFLTDVSEEDLLTFTGCESSSLIIDKENNHNRIESLTNAAFDSGILTVKVGGCHHVGGIQIR